MKSPIATTVIGATLAALATATCIASPAAAATSDEKTASLAQGRIIAQDARHLLHAHPSARRAITVRTEPGAKVTVAPSQGKGKTRAKKAGRDGVAIFTKLKAGRQYTVTASDESVSVVPVLVVGPAARLTARTTDMPTVVELTWDHRATARRGGASITYRLTATPITSTPGDDDSDLIVLEATATQSPALLTGLDPMAIYEFRVTPINALGDGTPSIARMATPLREQEPDTATPIDPPRPAPSRSTGPSSSESRTSSSPPSSPSGPRTRTVWVCPDDYLEVGDQCRKTADYTFTTQAYTFHDDVQTAPYTFHTVQTGPAPIISEFSTENVCPSGYNLEDYGAQGKICRLYGSPPTTQVKDPAPAGWTDNGTTYERTVQVQDETPDGFTDDGTQWIKRDDPPSGWTDDGTRYVRVTSKVAHTVVI